MQKLHGFPKDNLSLALATGYLLTVDSVSWGLPANKFMQMK